MKTKLNLIIYFLISAFMLLSCEEDALDPLTGKYTPPSEHDFTILASQSRVKEGSLYVFSIHLKDADSNSLNMKFVASDYILPASDFTPSETAVKKTYITGSNGSTFNGQQIARGTLTIALKDSTYTMNGILYLVDESVLKITGTFAINYQPDPYVPAYTYSIETETPALGGADGSVAITGTTKHKITFYADNVLTAYLEVVTNEDATSLSGTYTVKDGLDAAGQVNNGFYLDWSWWGGTGIFEGGSYYIKDDNKMFIREGEGDITIVDNVDTLTVTGTNLGILDLEALTASSGASWIVLGTPGSINIKNATSIDDDGEEPKPSFSYVNKITIPATFGFAGTVIEGSQLNVIKIVNTDNDTVASIELITDEGASSLTGDYNVVDGTNTTMVIGDANNGYYLDLSWYGMEGTMIGGCYYMESEETMYVRAGSVIHVVDNEGVLTITGTDLALLDVETLVNSSGATWANVSTTGSFSYMNVAMAKD